MDFDKFQSTRPARGATCRSAPCGVKARISIHAPREGRDKITHLTLMSSVISIHAPREGRDMRPLCVILSMLYFNPRAPRGARLAQHLRCIGNDKISIHAPREGRDRCP